MALPVILPSSNPVGMKLPEYNADLLTRFSRWDIKIFEPLKDEVIANSANGVWIQEMGNVSYQRTKNEKFVGNSTGYFQKNMNQNDNWMFGPRG